MTDLDAWLTKTMPVALLGIVGGIVSGLLGLTTGEIPTWLVVASLVVNAVAIVFTVCVRRKP